MVGEAQALDSPHPILDVQWWARPRRGPGFELAHSESTHPLSQAKATVCRPCSGLNPQWFGMAFGRLVRTFLGGLETSTQKVLGGFRPSGKVLGVCPTNGILKVF
jgi:hypothetical protein